VRRYHSDNEDVEISGVSDWHEWICYDARALVGGCKKLLCGRKSP
jgi:hypothetical protein